MVGVFRVWGLGFRLSGLGLRVWPWAGSALPYLVAGRPPNSLHELAKTAKLSTAQHTTSIFYDLLEGSGFRA